MRTTNDEISVVKQKIHERKKTLKRLEESLLITNESKDMRINAEREIKENTDLLAERELQQEQLTQDIKVQEKIVENLEVTLNNRRKDFYLLVAMLTVSIALIRMIYDLVFKSSTEGETKIRDSGTNSEEKKTTANKPVTAGSEKTPKKNNSTEHKKLGGT